MIGLGYERKVRLDAVTFGRLQWVTWFRKNNLDYGRLGLSIKLSRGGGTLGLLKLGKNSSCIGI